AEGASFSEAVTKCGIFSGVYARMLAVGFKTGATDVIMKKLAERYEIEVDDSLSNIISVLEPSLVAVLSVIVGMILLSVMLPLMGIMSSIG
ncbi:MAG: type II secretion system F family protein, partial [Oscillospiraceae bacterium]